MPSLDELTRHLREYLRLDHVPDDARALNGLQVENSGRVDRLAVAVDACQATIDGAADRGANLLLVHHGLFWGGLEPIAGRHGRRIRALVRHDLALYAAHLPLDCHPEVGNNAVLGRALGLSRLAPFGDYEGIEIGVVGEATEPLDALAARLGERLGVDPYVIARGPARPARVAVVTGAASSFLREARDAGIDTFITGEGPHHTFFDAEEWGLNLIYAGHYATETVGVKALAEHLEGKFGIPWDFIDHPTGL